MSGPYRRDSPSWQALAVLFALPRPARITVTFGGMRKGPFKASEIGGHGPPDHRTSNTS